MITAPVKIYEYYHPQVDETCTINPAHCERCTGYVAEWACPACDRPKADCECESGYRDCACRDCFEIAIGTPGAMCHGCEEAGCEGGDHECEAREASEDEMGLS